MYGYHQKFKRLFHQWIGWRYFCCQETFIHWNVPWFPVDIPIHWFSTHLDQVSQPSALPIAFPWALCCQRIALHGWVPACWSWMQWQQVRISGWFGSGLITSLNDWECKGGIINYGEMELRIYFLNFNWMDCNRKMLKVRRAHPHFDGWDLQFVAPDPVCGTWKRVEWMLVRLIWGWVNTSGTIFGRMNIHEHQLFWFPKNGYHHAVAPFNPISTANLRFQVNKWRCPKMGLPQ